MALVRTTDLIYEDSVDPTILDNFASGFKVGDDFRNTVTNKAFMCIGDGLWKDLANVLSSAILSASGQVVDNTDPNNPIFNENTYTEESTIIAGSATGLWVVRSLGLAYANHDVEMKVYKSANNNIAQFGVRELGSTVPKFFPIRRQTTHMEVRADSNGDIEIQGDDAAIIFEVTGKKPIV